jgi:hypothetical protein
MIEGKSGFVTSNVMIIGIQTQALTFTSPKIPASPENTSLLNTNARNTLAQ